LELEYPDRENAINMTEGIIADEKKLFPVIFTCPRTIYFNMATFPCRKSTFHGQRKMLIPEYCPGNTPTPTIFVMLLVNAINAIFSACFFYRIPSYTKLK
jgi:hypothetical protein